MPESPVYLAHSAADSGHEDPLRHHLTAVADLAAQFADAWGGAEEARACGLLHDLGKYGELFQRRLRGLEKGIDHWTAGAWEALMRLRAEGTAAALAIQGHHLGLQEASRDALRRLNPAKCADGASGLRLSAPEVTTLSQCFAADGLALASEVPVSAYAGLNGGAAAMLDVRMLYSCIVDADFLATEAHFRAPTAAEEWCRPAGPALEPERLLEALLAYLRHLAATAAAAPHIVGLRNDLLAACLAAAEEEPGLFTLTAPTGSGKTLAMLAFALAHAAKHGLRRVVTVLPFLTIIEQTAAAYRQSLAGAVGASPEVYVLEDHSMARAGESAGDEQDCAARLLAENWDSPLVVTTSVRFLESLFSNRPSDCRKLHRLASSVILLDEVQTLAPKLAVPTLATLSRLAERYGATVVMATATQPAFGGLHSHVAEYCPSGWETREIVPDPSDLFARARRTRVRWPEAADEPVSWPELADELSGLGTALCIVNLKRHAFALLDELESRGVDGVVHLSTNMCPAHRSAVLGCVRQRLSEGEPCLLVSTQCVEAGVDLDFPVVYRAMAPLDAIAQAAGRCNRGGRSESGLVRVFRPADERGLYPGSAYSQAAGVTESLLRLRYGEVDIDDPEVYADYFRTLYDVKGGDMMPLDLREAIGGQRFTEVSRLYRVIDQNTINILVPYDVGTHEQLADEARRTGLRADWIRRARPHTIGIYRPKETDPVRRHLEALPIGFPGPRRELSDEWFIYLEPRHYDPVRGLAPPAQSECLIA